MKAIVTKFSAGTNTRGSRIIASDSDKNRVIYDHSHALSHDQAHAHAAIALCRKQGWSGVLLGPHGLPHNEFVFVFEDTIEEATAKHQRWPITLD